MLPGSATCGPDTIRYPLAKADSLESVPMNPSQGFDGLYQFYDAPQPVTISGVEFFGWSDTLPAVQVTVSIFRAGNQDSLPQGSAVATATITVDSSFGTGSLNDLRRVANFSPAVTLNQDFLVVISHTTPTNVNFLTNSWFNGNGSGEWLSAARFAGNWVRGHQVSFNSLRFNADVLAHPIVTYDISAGFSSSPPCPEFPDTVFFTNIVDPVFDHRMYNSAVFYQFPDTSFSWDFGDSSGIQFQRNPFHYYSTSNFYSVTVYDTLRGWTGYCAVDTVDTLAPAIHTDFSYIIYGDSVVYADGSAPGPVNWVWNFGDLTVDSIQNPSHVYSSSGNYRVCLTSDNSQCADTHCENISIYPLTGCPQDTVRYPLAKTTQLNSVLLDSTNGFVAVSQYFEVPDSLVLYGLEFFAWTDSIPSGLAVEIYEAGNDSLPMGPLITSVSVEIDSAFGGGSLNSTRKNAVFPIAPTLSGPFLVILRNPSGSAIHVRSNNWITGEGGGEWLSNTRQDTSWRRSYATTINGIPFNADLLFHPIVTYNLIASPDPDFWCLPDSQTIHFGNNSSDIFWSKMYNQAIFQGNADTSFHWSYGDGNNEYAGNPSHYYGTGGPFTVTLHDTLYGWTRNCFADSTITLGPGTPAGYSYTFTNLSVFFNDTSNGNPVTWNWDFGDSTSSSQQDPVHTFPVQGTYLVCMEVGDTCNTDSICKSITLVCPPPTAGFEDSLFLLNLHLTDTSRTTNTFTTYLWDFGDGGTDTVANPVHTYTNDGIYTVCLIAIDSCGTDTFCKQITVNCPSPAGGFTYSGTPGLQVVFSDTSTSPTPLTQWSWSFGDGTTSTAQNPSHFYPTSGTYQVCLTVYNGCGFSTVCKQVTVTCTSPVANYSYSSQTLTAYFTDQTTSGFAGYSYLWDFGDGNTSTQANPAHTYTAGGTYQVCLTVTDSCSQSNICQNVTINCTNPNPLFAQTNNLLTIQLTDFSQTSNTILEWNWDFGDGNTDTVRNPTHTYATSGNYVVCLSVRDSCGRDTACLPVTISCPIPRANFGANVNGMTANFSDLSNGININTWAWDFGDGNTSPIPNPSHTYLINGNYRVCLAVTDTCGTDTFCSITRIQGPVGLEDAPGGITVSPNPADELLRISWDHFPGNTFKISVLDLRGKSLREVDVSLNGGTGYQIPVGDLPAGSYFLLLESGDSRWVRKFTVVHD